MVAIPEDVKKLIRSQQVIIVGTADEKGLSNISPRTTFYLSDDDKIYWLELFKHKSYYNFKKNNWISVAVFDKSKLIGYQLKGTVTVLTDKEKSYKIQLRIVDRLTRLDKERILRQIGDDVATIIEFQPRVVYSLNPNETADIPIELDADVKIGRLVGGVDIKTSFGIEQKNFEG